MKGDKREMLLSRIQLRIDEADMNIDKLNELLQTVNDRLCIQLTVKTLPKPFESICVDATVKMYRRMYFEGISTESATNLSTTFVNDVLAEYSSEITAYLESKSNQGKVVFM